jgi:hypothetical protein
MPMDQSRLQTSKFSMTSFYVISFICLSVRATLTIFFYDKCTCSKASMHASFWVHALVIEKIVKVQILFVCMGQQRKLVKVIWEFDVIGQK